MRVVCAGCGAFTDCEEYVERYGIVSGFWAGRERTSITDSSERGGAA
jgi:hypothetical protein